MTNNIAPVILCGGGGTRLWPKSRIQKPKPFLPLIGEQTLFEATVARCTMVPGAIAPTIVTGAAHVDHVTSQLAHAPNARIIVEPSSRNTAAAIALAAHRLDADTIMLICPSDHHIPDADIFAGVAEHAADIARQDWLVSLGIAARSPETGFGYLQQGDPIGEIGFRVSQFVEKPPLARAQEFVASGEYCWNAGIFAFRAGYYLDELKRHRPELASAVGTAAAQGKEKDALFHPDPEAFAAIVGESVDYAVMENTDRAAMVAADMQWSDIGTWQALQLARDRDASGNHIIGMADLIDCRNVLVDSDGPRVSVIGLEDAIVVVDGDDILVTTASQSQKVGTLNGAKQQ